jgi:hypothetical protein
MKNKIKEINQGEEKSRKPKRAWNTAKEREREREREMRDEGLPKQRLGRIQIPLDSANFSLYFSFLISFPWSLMLALSVFSFVPVIKHPNPKRPLI